MEKDKICRLEGVISDNVTPSIIIEAEGRL